MSTYLLTAVCHFGMEAVTKREIYDLGYEIEAVLTGRVKFLADAEGIVRANMFLRTPERILLELGFQHVETFEELFESVYSLPWGDFIPADGAFPVSKVTTLRSALFSIRDIQAITKKAIVEQLKKVHKTTVLPETGAVYPVTVSIMNDTATFSLDTTGPSLHRRGYRRYVSKAPLSETLAASIIQLSPYNAGRALADPFCGSGTIPIEAAMMAMNIAPGIKRKFDSMNWRNLIPPREWVLIREEAYDAVEKNPEIDIQAFDIDPRILRAARENAAAAGVAEVIHFQQRDINDFSTSKKYGFMITNPPYGKRLADTDAVHGLYEKIGEIIRMNPTWSFFILSAYSRCTKAIGRESTKNRKVYSGMLKTYLHQYMGEKPHKSRPVDKAATDREPSA
ncbi:MAG: class I SAM-dependent RNA methyltransferase [Eubacteriales bacterium]|nr:class I SAM-dependent RNA methyltransferase [Eubacteriales bacterium]